MTELRQGLRDLATRAQTYGDARAAIRTARRRRAARHSVVAATVALAVAGSATLWAQLRESTDPLPPADAPSVIYFSDGSVLARLDNPEDLDKPSGLVVRHVLGELTTRPGSPLMGHSFESLRDGGYEIATTIDPRAQAVLEATADETVAGSLMAGRPESMQAAAVVIEPGTGRVLAYYGGSTGTGSDYAGAYPTEEGHIGGYGRHNPGGSFMVYTLAAALKAGYSLNSRWLWTAHEQEGRSPGNPVRDRRTCPDSPDGDSCSLLDSFTASLNVPLYDVTVSLTPASVLELARDAGLNHIWSSYDLRRLDLHGTAATDVIEQGELGAEIGFGQYPVTVLDQANAMATFAAGGLRVCRRRDGGLGGRVQPGTELTA